MRTTYITKPAEIERKWYVVDAEGKTLGRLATEVATVLRGKHKPIFMPHVDAGDHVIVINAEKIVVTGNKLEQKTYFTHSGWAGGDKQTPLKVMLDKKPEEVISHAVKGMLPKNVIGRQAGDRLRVFKGPDHKHEAQKPEVLELKY